MNFAQLIAEVGVLTGRPDLTAKIVSAIKRSTLRAHHRDFYARDLYEVPLIFDSSAFLQQIDYLNFLPRFRAMNYLRYFDPTTNTAGLFFIPSTSQEVLDAWGVEKTDIFYSAGSLIQIKAANTFQYALAGFYLHPDISENNFTSWIASEHPYAIAFHAARTIFKGIGKDEEANALRDEVAEQDHLVDVTGLTTAGF